MRKTGVLAGMSVLFVGGVCLAQPGADEPADPPPAAPEPAPAAEPPPPASDTPPGPYYSEPPPAQGAAPRGASAPPPGAPGQYVYEPPPPYAVYEPPPPPKPRHVAPKYSLWLGARLGWFIPFGNLWAEGDPNTRQLVGEVKWSQYASAGPMFELDAGARLGRYYTLFLLWERAQLGAGDEKIAKYGTQERGETDYYALGLRFSSNPDKVGFLTEINLGYRRFRSIWDSGAELRMTEAPLEFRLGLGADIRISRLFSLSPLVTLGAGSFGSAEWLNPNGSTADATTPGDQAAGHGWVTFQLGGHFDIAGSD